MFKNLFKKKKNFVNAMVYKEVIDCSNFYVVHNFRTDERKIMKKKEAKLDENTINRRAKRKDNQSKRRT